MNEKIAVRDRHLTSLFIIFGVFVSGLVVNTVVASKLVAFGPLVVPASVFVWALTYPVMDIVTEVYGPKYARKVLWGGFFALLAMFFYFWTCVLMPSAPFWQGQEQFVKYFGTSARVIVACIISYLSTQFLDVYVFTKIRHATRDKFLWLRSAGSTLIAQTLANIIFTVIVFAGVLSFEDWSKLFWGNLTMRYALVVSDVLIVYAVVGVLFKLYPELKGEK